MLDLVHDAIRDVRNNHAEDNGELDLEKSVHIENSIDIYRDELMEFHYTQLEENKYSKKAGFMFLDYLNRMGKIGDHLFNVNEALAGWKVKATYDRVAEVRE